MKKSMSFREVNPQRFSMGDWILRGAMIVFFLITNMLVFGQVSQLETDKGIVASIAPYNVDVRQAILQASQYPQILTQLQKSQAQTIESFQSMIGSFRQTKQAWFYTLTRYPDLMHSLAILPKKQNKEDVYRLLPNQDPDLQKAAWQLYCHEKEDLVKVDNIKISAQQEFEKIIQNLDVSSIAAFQKLSTMPDVLTLMTNNIELTSKLGNQFRENPMQLNEQLTVLHDSLNVQNQYEIATFKKQLEENPQAMQEMGQAAKDYASANGYNLPTQQNYNNYPSNYYGNPYSYWFGYPSWYGSPMWYPGGFGFNSGFYSGIGGFGIYGFPSYGFSNWFFNLGYYNRYPNLYRQFGNYYHGNISGHRVMGSVNNGFMGAANHHYTPNGGNRLNYLTSPSGYSRQGRQTYQNNSNTTHSNANTYHTQSWGSYGGRGNAVGGGNSRGSSGVSRGGRH